MDALLDKLQWLGHDGFRINAEQTIYIDPYELRDPTPADLVFITHEHFDHCSPEDIARIQHEGTRIVTEKDSAAKLSGDITVMAPGERTEFGGVEIEAVPAYNLDKHFHPRAKGWLGFILTIGGTRIYHAGDTDRIPEMADIETDIALLPVSGTYVMTAEEAVGAALDIGPKLAIPMHYGGIVGSDSDADIFRRALDGKIAVQILDAV